MHRHLMLIRHHYGERYFKQDFANIKFGDAADGHHSRTHKGLLLRAVRRLLEIQDLLIKARPEVTAEITHEICLEKPDAPCDVAAFIPRFPLFVPQINRSIPNLTATTLCQLS